MADTYGALTGRAGVCLATLGPGALNLILGIANAQLDSHPLVALMAQAGLDRIYKESHQVVDLVSVYRPVTKWGDIVTVRDAAPEMVRKAFKQAQTERPGATFIVLPEDVAERETDATPAPGERAARPRPLRRPGPPGGPRPGPGAAPGRARGRRRGARRRDGRAAPVLRGPADPRRDDLPGQRRVPRRPRARAGHDRLHGQGLRELRVRPRRRRGRGRVRPRGVRRRCAGTQAATSGSSMSTGRWPRSTRTTVWRSGSRDRSASRSTPSPRAARSTRSAATSRP